MRIRPTSTLLTPEEAFTNLSDPYIQPADLSLPEEDVIITEERTDSAIQPPLANIDDIPIPPDTEQPIMETMSSQNEPSIAIIDDDDSSVSGSDLLPNDTNDTNSFPNERVETDPSLDHHIPVRRSDDNAPVHRYNTRYRGDRLRSIALFTSLRKQLNDPIRGDAAREALAKELSALHDKGVFQPLLLGEEAGLKAPIPCHTVFKEKFTPDGKFDRLKARLVAGGNHQPRDQLYDDISSPTVATPFLFAIGSIAAKERRFVIGVDVPTAYLNADSSALDITLDIPRDEANVLCTIFPAYKKYLRANGKIRVKMMRALYGCIESAMLWYQTIRRVLESLGFTANPVEQCVFNKEVKGTQCTCVLYVDDLLFTCADTTIIEDTLNHLESVFECKLTRSEGPVLNYLGMIFDFSTPSELSITMPGYITDLLSDSSTTSTSTTPAGLNLFVVGNSPPLSLQARERFHSLTARLLYLAKRIRPDILLTISYLTTRVQSPNDEDSKKLSRVLAYLNGTKDLGLRLEYDPSVSLHTFVDASYGVHDDLRSHTGMTISLGKGTLEADSNRQKINTKSSTEAELIGVSDKAGKVLWHQEFLLHQGIQVSPARIYQDNLSTMALLKNGKPTSNRTRHVSIRYFWLKDRVDAKDVEVVYCPTDHMVADILTKPLVGEHFFYLRDLLLNWKYRY